MAGVTEEEFQKKQDEVQALRERVAAAQAEKDSKERAVSREIDSTELDAEKIKLQAQLDALKGGNTLTAIRAANEPLVDAVNDDKKAATVVAKEGA